MGERTYISGGERTQNSTCSIITAIIFILFRKISGIDRKKTKNPIKMLYFVLYALMLERLGLQCSPFLFSTKLQKLS